MSELAERIWVMIHGPGKGKAIPELVELCEDAMAEVAREAKREMGRRTMSFWQEVKSKTWHDLQCVFEGFVVGFVAGAIFMTVYITIEGWCR